ncbi:hypothetical protein P9112_005786 [Eukaryota sp. TZLM1-RC]
MTERPDFLCFQCPSAEDSLACVQPRGICGKDSALESLNRNVIASCLSLSLNMHPLHYHYIEVPDHTYRTLFYSLALISTSENYDANLVAATLTVMEAERATLRKMLREHDLAPPKYSLTEWTIGRNRNEQSLNGELFNSQTVFESLGDDVVAGFFELMVTSALPGYAKLLLRLNVFSSFTVDSIAVCSDLAIAFDNGSTIEDVRSMYQKLGEVYYKTSLELDESLVNSFGLARPRSIEVNYSSTGPAVVVYGDNLYQFYSILETLSPTINVYSSGNLIKAHSYPFFQKFPNLVGHYSNIYQNQRLDFESFPGLIILLNGPTLPLHLTETNYSERIYLANTVGIPGLKRISSKGGVLDLSIFSNFFFPSFDPLAPARFDPMTFYSVYHWNSRLRTFMPEFVDLFKKGKLENVLVIGGSDGALASENLNFMKIFKALPITTVVFLFGSVKFRVLSSAPFLSTDFSVSNVFPRVLDFGGFEDCASIVETIYTLSSVMKVEPNQLPIKFILSWYEAESIGCLSLLNYLGFPVLLTPKYPVFFSKGLEDCFCRSFGVSVLE